MVCVFRGDSRKPPRKFLAKRFLPLFYGNKLLKSLPLEAESN
jgi:hypothetical protein